MTMLAEIEPPPAAGASCESCGGVSFSPVVADLEDYLTHELFQIHRCNTCGLQQTSPLPTGNSIGEYYPPRYRGNRHAFTGGMRSNLRRRAVESHFAKNFKGRLLDIGCGDGSFARHMKSKGWDVAATEIDPETVSRLREQGIDAKLSSEANFDRPFDAITCWHVMEHLPEPRQMTEWAKSQLAAGGIFQVTVPNIDCLQAKRVGRHWVHLDVPRHRQHYSPATLKTQLQQAGFTITHQTNFAFEYDWFGIIQSALNLLCTRQNVLFDQLTHAPKDPTDKASILDSAMSIGLAPFIAISSLLPMLATAAAGDGATLTLTCKAGETNE